MSRKSKKPAPAPATRPAASYVLAPPRRNFRALVASLALLAAWVVFLAWLALAGD